MGQWERRYVCGDATNALVPFWVLGFGSWVLVNPIFEVCYIFFKKTKKNPQKKLQKTQKKGVDFIHIDQFGSIVRKWYIEMET